MKTSYLMAVALTASACTAPMTVDRTLDATTSTHHVAVMISGPNPIYEEVLQGFQGAFHGSLKVYNNVNEDTVSARALRATVEATRPDVVFTLGDAATQLALEAHLDTPVLFAVVVDPEALGVTRAPNFFGVSMTVGPAAAFTRFKTVAPHMARVLAFYQEDSTAQLMHQAAKELETLDIALTALHVSSVSQVQDAVEENKGKYDGIWMTADPVVVNPQAFAYLRDATLAAKKILLSTVSERFTEAGALASVSSDFRSMGSLAALLFYRVSEQHTAPDKIGIRPPVGAKVSINLNTAQEIGLPVEAQGMLMVSAVYRK